MVTLSVEECRELCDLIGTLTGHSPENVFANDGTDDWNDAGVRALAKVYRAGGLRVPPLLNDPEGQ